MTDDQLANDLLAAELADAALVLPFIEEIADKNAARRSEPHPFRAERASTRRWLECMALEAIEWQRYCGLPDGVSLSPALIAMMAAPWLLAWRADEFPSRTLGSAGAG